MGHGLGHLGVQEMGTSEKVAKRKEKAPLSGWKAVILWLRGLDLNQRPPGYELRLKNSSVPFYSFWDGFVQELRSNWDLCAFPFSPLVSPYGSWYGSKDNVNFYSILRHCIQRRTALRFTTIAEIYGLHILVKERHRGNSSCKPRCRYSFKSC